MMIRVLIYKIVPGDETRRIMTSVIHSQMRSKEQVSIRAVTDLMLSLLWITPYISQTFFTRHSQN